MRAELAGAFMLLTRLPVAWLAGARQPAGIADSAWAFPLVGAVVGAIGGGVYWVFSRIGLPSALAAVWTLAAMMLTTGALHEDGLADTSDGFGGGRTREQKLDIMRDSRIGSFGALALVVTTAARGTALAIVAAPAHVAAALVAAGALGRFAIMIVVLALPPARSDGLASGLREHRRLASIVGPLLTVALVVEPLSDVTMLAAVGAALAAALVFARVARRQIGGYTGDVLGAVSVLVECVVLGLLATPWAGFRVTS